MLSCAFCSKALDLFNYRETLNDNHHCRVKLTLVENSMRNENFFDALCSGLSVKLHSNTIPKSPIHCVLCRFLFSVDKNQMLGPTSYVDTPFVALPYVVLQRPRQPQ